MPRRVLQAAARLRGASQRVGVFTSRPVTACPSCASSLRRVERDDDVRVVVLVHPGVEDARSPRTTRMIGIGMPVTGSISFDMREQLIESTPGTTFSRSASFVPSTAPRCLPSSVGNVKSPAVACCRMRRHLRDARRRPAECPRRTPPRNTCASPRERRACVCTNGAAATTPGCASRPSSAPAASPSSPCPRRTSGRGCRGCR